MAHRKNLKSAVL